MPAINVVKFPNEPLAEVFSKDAWGKLLNIVLNTVVYVRQICLVFKYYFRCISKGDLIYSNIVSFNNSSCSIPGNSCRTALFA